MLEEELKTNTEEVYILYSYIEFSLLTSFPSNLCLSLVHLCVCMYVTVIEDSYTPLQRVIFMPFLTYSVVYCLMSTRQDVDQNHLFPNQGPKTKPRLQKQNIQKLSFM